MNSDQWSALAQLLGSIGIGALLLKVVERIFARSDKRTDELGAFRTELRGDITNLKLEIRERDDEIEKLRKQYYGLLERVTKLTAENHAIRSENDQIRHVVTSYFLEVQLIFKRTPALADQEPPALPEWLTQSAPGPTKAREDDTG